MPKLKKTNIIAVISSAGFALSLLTVGAGIGVYQSRVVINSDRGVNHEERLQSAEHAIISMQTLLPEIRDDARSALTLLGDMKNEVSELRLAIAARFGITISDVDIESDPVN